MLKHNRVPDLNHERSPKEERYFKGPPPAFLDESIYPSPQAPSRSLQPFQHQPQKLTNHCSLSLSLSLSLSQKKNTHHTTITTTTTTPRTPQPQQTQLQPPDPSPSKNNSSKFFSATKSSQPARPITLPHPTHTKARQPTPLKLTCASQQQFDVDMQDRPGHGVAAATSCFSNPPPASPQ
jgi:hypothetical protein